MPADRFFIARHGETVFNAAARLQGDSLHTPLTRAGFLQADAMGAALAAHLGEKPSLTLWASDTGRALQTLAIVTEHLGLDWHDARTDPRLGEIGMGEWGGRYYKDVAGEAGTIFDRETGLFARKAPGGEWYDDIAARLQGWIDDTAGESGDRLVIMHGMSSRVLRGMMTRIDTHPHFLAPIAEGLEQGSMVVVQNGVEMLIRRGTGYAPA